MTESRRAIYRRRGHNVLFIAFFFHQFLLHPCVVVADLSTSTKHSNNSTLQRWIQARCNHDKQHGVWAYEGTLYDPMTGQPIAAVEGLELIRRLSRPLISEPLLPNAESILIRRLFGYRYLQQQQQQQEEGWMSSFRLRPTSPKRIIPLQQAATVYDMAVTFVPDPNEDSQWHIHAEWPNGQTLWSSASIDQSLDSLRMTSFTRPSSKQQQETLLPPWQQKNQTSSSSSRRQLIQFSGNGVPEKRLGAQETYRYTFGGSQQQTTPATVDYTRYGEGPVWYGRYCSLQLKGRPCHDNNMIPTSLMNLSKRIPGFWVLHDGTAHNDETAMQWFAKEAVMARIVDEDAVPQSLWKHRIVTWTGRIRDASRWMDRIPSRME